MATSISIPQSQQRPLTPLMLLLLLLVGLYFPTSTAGNPSFAIYVLASLISAGLLVWLGFGVSTTPNVLASLMFLSIIPLVLVFTVTSGVYTYAFGGLLPYGMVTLLCLLNFKNVQFPDWLSRVFTVANIFNILICVGIVLGSKSVAAMVIAHYSYSGVGFVQRMLLFRKPVFMFGSHSNAGFFWYLFFYVSLQTHKLRGKKLYLIFAFLYWAITTALLSVTGVLFSGLAAIQMMRHLWTRARHPWIWLVTGVTLGVIALGSIGFGSSFNTAADVISAANGILSNQGSGFNGRFLPGGTMYEDLVYLKEHPFRPTGVSFREGLVVGDSGVITLVLQGSVILLVLVYSGYFLFLKRSLLDRQDVYLFFVAAVAFEMGYGVIGYFRYMCLLPFFVVYLNWLRREQDARKVPQIEPVFS